MRRIVFSLSISLCFLSLKAQSPVLMTVGDAVVTKADFEYLFFKNNIDGKINTQTLDEYMNLYKKFKLKVVEAEALGYDSMVSFKREFNAYRSQIAEPYLKDKKAEEALVQEAYEHLLQDVDLSSILVKLPQDATPDDTLNAYNKALNIVKRLKKEDFGKVAAETSDDYNAKTNKGNVGWLTGQMVTYPLEKAMYSLPVGQVSQPIRTSYGYHIIKINNRRPAVGKVLAAHILKKFPENATKAQIETARLQIYNLYDSLKKGDDFATLAKKYSDDKTSAQNGGTLQWFGVGRMIPEFEKEAFALKNTNDISEPFQTQFGYHIIKLLDKKPVGSYEDLKPAILKSFSYDGRANAAKNAMVEKLKKEYGYTFDNNAYNEILNYAKKFSAPDSSFAAGAKVFKKPLFLINNQPVTQEKFIKYVYNKSNNVLDNALQATIELKDDFIGDEIISYEDSQLERKYPAFKYLLEEYHDGILLFNISNDSVWEKASNDKAGLERYFRENVNNYAWGIPHYKGFIFYCKDKKIAQKTQKAIKKLPQDSIISYIKNINKDSLIIDFQYGLWTKGENQVIDNLGFGDKLVKFTPTQKYPHVFVFGKILKNLPDSYTDVRGAVTTDYQNYLEQEWVKYLEKKYPVKINQKVYNEVLKDVQQSN